MQKRKIPLIIIRYYAKKNIPLCIFIREMKHTESIRHEGIVESIGADSV